MSDTATRKAIQEDELQVIAAIFDDVKDMREKDVWKVDRPPEILVTCDPQSSDSTGGIHEKYVTVKLNIKLTDNYPNEPPVLTFIEMQGLSDKQLRGLKEGLDALARHLLGQEMMFELINHTQSYLYANNKPPAKSFYDQMITNRQKETEEKQRKDEEVKRQQLLQEDQEIEAELEKQQNEIREENRRRREARKISECESEAVRPAVSGRLQSKSPRRQHHDSTGSGETAVTRQTLQLSNGEMKCPPDHTKVKEVKFTLAKTNYTVMRGTCTYHDPAGSVLFTGLDTTKGTSLSLRQWTMDFTGSKVSKTANIATCKKLLGAAEQDLAKLLKLKHENLINCLSMHIITESAKVVVMVLTEPRPGLPLTQFVNLPCKIELNTISIVTSQLVNSLVYLHSHSVVHKDIRPSVVYIDHDMVRLADFGLYRRLNEIYQAAAAGNIEAAANPTVKRGQKEDVFRLGLTILFMVTKKFNEDERLPTIPKETKPELKDFLNKCFNVDEKMRWSAVQLSDHSLLKPRDKSEHSADPVKPEADDIEKNEEEDQDAHLEAIILRDTSGASRLASEFQILDIIGKGGFGEVLKARNKLDRCLYAIKRIKLNPKSKMLNKRITREVKLLSRLNHENVVRYYNSWIETSTLLTEAESSTDTCTSNTTNTSNKKSKSSLFSSPTDGSDSIERNAPGMVDKSVAWSDASSNHSTESESSEDSDDESSDEIDDFFGHSFMPHLDSESEDVVFDHDDEDSSRPSQSSEAEDSTSSEATKVLKLSPKQNKDTAPLHTQFMYIQMEYCEKNTLRQAIDMGLHEDIDRVWRLFREIIDGLHHLHEQGMIHRDLKPVNIFLDLNDHVKIGDFGLATTALIAQLPEEGPSQPDHGLSADTALSQSMSMGDGRHTGRVGTLLYVSPEIKMCHGKTAYTQKVDIYSLGIIFFEMCYRSLTTLMERDIIIGNIRRPEVIFPEDFRDEKNSKQMSILRWVLNHDSSKRPSAAELLQSDYLPQLEEEEVYELFRSTLANPQTKSYKKMISTIFSQPLTRKFDFTYDFDVHKGVSISYQLCRSIARQRLEDIFSRHGALEIDLPTMLPKVSHYEKSEQNVTFMDHAGNLVSLPYDLRVPFARFAARNNIANLKRYTISKVFRERKPHGIHPQEHFHCAFDIISPSRESIIPDAEVLSVIQQIIDAFPRLSSMNYTIHMNHALLMKAILLYCGVTEEQHAEVLAALADTKAGGGRSKTTAYSRLQALSINEQTISQICTFIEMKAPFSAVSGYLRRITKSGLQASSLAKTALHELETLITYSTALGVTMPVTINLGFVHEILNSSGVMYQIAAEVIVTKQNKQRSNIDVLAGGYRYDKLVSRFRRVGKSDMTQSPAAVGVTLLFDRLVQAVSQEKGINISSSVQVVLFCIGKASMQKEWLNLAKELWQHGLKLEILTDASMEVEKIETMCRDAGIRYLVTLSDYEPGQAKLNIIEKERVIEKRYSMGDIVEELIKRVQPTITTDRSNRAQSTDQSTSQNTNTSQDKSDRNTEIVNHTFQSNLPISLILTLDTKQVSLKARNKTETMIHNHLNNTVLCLLKRGSEAEVVAFELGLSEVKLLYAAYADSDNEDQFEHNCNIAIERQESAKNRKYIPKICNRLRQIKFQQNRPPVVILFGLKDNSYRVIMG